jgi:hypothetical protein
VTTDQSRQLAPTLLENARRATGSKQENPGGWRYAEVGGMAVISYKTNYLEQKRVTTARHTNHNIIRNNKVDIVFL